MGALAGIRVVEIGSGVGPSYCGKLLAHLGADVVKVEPPGGDQLRREGPFPGDEPHPEKSGLFLHLNTAKRGVVLQPGDVRTRDLLLSRADVVILGQRTSALASDAIDPETLRDRFPRLIIASVSSFGLAGPYADFLGGELIAYAVGGYMLLTGAPERQPLKAYGHLVEYQAGAHAALGVMASLHARDRTGEGQIVDASAMEAATFMIGGVEQSAYFYGRIARRNGTRLLGFPPQQPYPSTIRPCRDGYVHCHSNNRHRDLLGMLIPHPRLTDPEVLATMFGHADEIDAIMDEWLADKDRGVVVHMAQELRLPFTEVHTPGEVVADASYRARGSFVDITQPAVGRIPLPAPPIRMSVTPCVTGPAPGLGEHTNDVRDELDASPRPPEPPRRASQAGAAPSRPLAGVRVIDFTNAVAGPIASFILGDLGADVIKIEAPNGRPLNAAGTAPIAEGAGDQRPYDRIMTFNELNHGKRGVTLDVATPAGRELFLRLVAVSDVVVQNFSPRVMHNLGLDYNRLREARPDIILVSMPAFGLEGPYRDRISYGPGIDAMSGLAHLTGYPDGPPMKPGNFFCDQQAGVLSAFAAQAALWHRARAGQGQHVELAMIEGEFQVLADAYLDYEWNGRERMRAANDHPRFAPHDAYRSLGEDAWVAIAVENDEQWRALCSVIGREDLAADPRYAEQAVRHANRASLRPIVEAWTGTRTHYDGQAALQAAGVPAGAALNCLELLSDPQVVARHGFEYVDVPDAGPTPYPRVAFTLSETPVPISRPAPRFAEDNEAVFCGLLGLSPSELSDLEAGGVVARVPTGGH